MDCQHAQQIAGDFLQEEIKSVQPLVGKGSVNTIFVVHTSSLKVVVRMNKASDSLQVYHKERWCMEQASLKGIPGPSVLELGQAGRVAFMIQTFVEGVNGEDDFGHRDHIWRRLGEYAKVIHSIRVNGYGEYLSDPLQGSFVAPPHDNFDGTWPSYLDYNMESLTENDELIRLGVLTRELSQGVKKRFEALLKKDFTLGLNHGDISLKNTILDSSGKVTLLDWGSAEVAIVPQGDLIQILKCHLELHNPNESHLNYFLDGYGISPQDYKEMKYDLDTLLVLRAFDKLRWAIACNPRVIPEYVDYAKMLLARH
jgi:aminoglycoside phosphotransferase (APT) family kinase protein